MKQVNYDKIVKKNLPDENKLTNAGALLSDQGALKQSKIVCTRWKGLTKGVISEDAIDDKEYTSFPFTYASLQPSITATIAVEEGYQIDNVTGTNAKANNTNSIVTI